MGAAKWIGGIIGFMSMGPLGALAGYAIGQAFENITDNNKSPKTSNKQQEKRNSFMFSMLVLAAYIIKADGKIMHSEMEQVRRFLRNNFGQAAKEQGEEIILKLFEQQKMMDNIRPGAYKNTIHSCATQIADNLNYGERLQLVEFLIEIIKADGKIAPQEIDALNEITAYLRISKADVESMLNLGDNATIDNDYKVLEITPQATDAEVRAAYRKLALKHHPDKVSMLGEDVRQAAEKKMQQINAAKERIYKARGMK